MRLYLMRHAEADVEHADDAKRELTARGLDDAGRLANYLHQHETHVAHVFHSGMRRAEQTAEILAKVIAPGQSLQVEAGFTGQHGLTPVLELMAGWREDTLVVSHLPFISRLLSRLVCEDPDIKLVNFEPATAVCLENAGGMWRIKWCLYPGLL